ncbi:MAG TPA: aldo/keto reductase, partial [Erysipelotrichaceae bacterium]|nr:aldo/keto reductase [Erysipelotrichaceae bacterium]
MKYIQLSRLNRDVSVIGVGCMRIARMTREEVSELVHTALDHGINFFDHADIYGRGRSEEVFGEVFATEPELRDRMFLQTKCGINQGMFDFSK